MLPGTPYVRHKGYVIKGAYDSYIHTYCTGDPLVSLRTLYSRTYIVRGHTYVTEGIQITQKIINE